MDTFLIMVLQPSIQICLQVVKIIIDLSVKSHSVELIQHRLVKSLTDTVALWTSGLVLARSSSGKYFFDFV